MSLRSLVRLSHHILIVACALYSLSSAGAQSAGRAASIGFRVELIPDSARQYGPEGSAAPRPLYALLWFPSDGGGRPLQFKDYAAEPGIADALHKYRERFEAEMGVRLV